MIRSLGVVTVPSPGTAVRATSNETDPAARVGAQTIRVQAVHSNTGRIYVGLRNIESSPTGFGTQMLAILPAPSHAVTGTFHAYEATVPNVPAGLNAADFWIDADQATDGALISISAQ